MRGYSAEINIFLKFEKPEKIHYEMGRKTDFFGKSQGYRETIFFF